MRIKPPKSSMPLLKKSMPKLYADERIVLKGQGGFKHHLRSGWKVAEIFLTNQRLILYQLQKIILEISLSRIYNIASKKLYYVMRKREALGAVYKEVEGSRGGTVWFVVNDSVIWKKRIYQLTLLKVDADLIKKIAVQLDSEGQDILWFLWENRYARIDRLAKLINAPNHMHVLLNIKETINPIAEKIAGCPILSFERSKIDSETGEKILFSWWLSGEFEEWENKDERLLDIFDEGSYIQVIMEVKKVEKSDLSLKINGTELIVKSSKTVATWTETFHLPAEANYDNHRIHLRNNLLEIRLSKVQGSVVSEQ